MDTIFIREFRLEALVGIYEWEKHLPQTIELSLEIGIPGTHVWHSDAIADTIDYGKVVERLRVALSEQRFMLLERLAEHVAHLILTEFGAPWVKISVAKLGMLRGVKQVGVTIERGKKTA